MKKILMATTALAALAASSVYAVDKTPGVVSSNNSNLNVTVGGDVDVRFSHFDQSDAADAAVGEASKKDVLGFATNKALEVSVSGEADMGMKYGALLRLEDKAKKDTSGDYFEVMDAKKAYIFMETSMGKVTLGMHKGPASMMNITGHSLAAATGGLDGDWTARLGGQDPDNTFMTSDFTLATGKTAIKGTTAAGVKSLAEDAVGTDYSTLPTGTAAGSQSVGVRGQFLMAPTLFMSNSGDVTHANKISYMSPSYSGLSMGVSFTPDMASHGPRQDGMNKYKSTTAAASQGALDKFTDEKNAKNVFEVGLAYDQTHGDVNVKASLTGITGQMKKGLYTDGDDTKQSSYKAYRGFAAGAQATWQGVSLAASYGDMGKSGLHGYYVDTQHAAENVSELKKRTYYYDLGLGYTMGPVQLSATYMHSVRWGNDLKGYSVGANYMLAPGLVPYVEYVHAKMKSAKETLAYKDGDDKSGRDTLRKTNDVSVIYVGTALKF